MYREKLKCNAIEEPTKRWTRTRNESHTHTRALTHTHTLGIEYLIWNWKLRSENTRRPLRSHAQIKDNRFGDAPRLLGNCTRNRPCPFHPPFLPQPFHSLCRFHMNLASKPKIICQIARWFHLLNGNGIDPEGSLSRWNPSEYCPWMTCFFLNFTSIELIWYDSYWYDYYCYFWNCTGITGKVSSLKTALKWHWNCSESIPVIETVFHPVTGFWIGLNQFSFINQTREGWGGEMMSSIAPPSLI